MAIALFREPLRHELVRMVGANLPEPCLADLLVRGQRVDAQHDAGFALHHAQGRRPCAFETRTCQAEDACDFRQIIGFRHTDPAIRLRDAE